MDTTSFILGIISSIIATGLITLFKYIYIGGRSFIGINKAIRLVVDASNSGINNIFESRKAYIRHKDHGTPSEYLNKANKSICYVGFWLAHGTEMEDICDRIKDLIYNKKVKVNIVFIDPKDDVILESCSYFLGIDKDEIKTRVLKSIKKFENLYEDLDIKYKDKLILSVHNVPLSASAFVIDEEITEKCRVLVDYKSYNFARQNSYGIEYIDSRKELCNIISKSYVEICNKSTNIIQKKAS